MKNTPRTPEYLTISRGIRKCENILQLRNQKNLVLKYREENKQDSAELMAIYIEREQELSPETIDTKVEPVTPYFEDEILNIHHKKLEAK